MLFSPSDLKSEYWLPQMPEIVAGKNIMDEDYKLFTVRLQQLATVNGLPNLQSYLSISGDIQKKNINESNGIKVILLIS